MFHITDIDGYIKEDGRACAEVTYMSGASKNPEQCAKWCNPEAVCKSFTFDPRRIHQCHMKTFDCFNTQEDDHSTLYRKSGNNCFLKIYHVGMHFPDTYMRYGFI